jgi:PhzF family phenazine biosynthesis protein
MTKYLYQQIDVFSLEPLKGNPLAVVIAADSLTDDQMLAFANWTNLSETSFLLKPRTAKPTIAFVFSPLRVNCRSRVIPRLAVVTFG